MAAILTKKLTTGNKTEIEFPDSFYEYNSLVISNTHTSAVDVSLWLTAQPEPNTTNTEVTTTGVYVNLVAGYTATTASQAVVIDNGSGGASAGTSDMFLNESVYKSDGTLLGVCTTFNSNVLLTFSGGLNNAAANNTILYTGTTYYIIKAVTIPAATSLKLNSDEFSFNNVTQKLYAKSSNASGLVDIIIR